MRILNHLSKFEIFINLLKCMESEVIYTENKKSENSCSGIIKIFYDVKKILTKNDFLLNDIYYEKAYIDLLYLHTTFECFEQPIIFYGCFINNENNLNNFFVSYINDYIEIYKFNKNFKEFYHAIKKFLLISKNFKNTELPDFLLFSFISSVKMFENLTKHIFYPYMQTYIRTKTSFLNRMIFVSNDFLDIVFKIVNYDNFFYKSNENKTLVIYKLETILNYFTKSTRSLFNILDSFQYKSEKMIYLLVKYYSSCIIIQDYIKLLLLMLNENINLKEFLETLISINANKFILFLKIEILKEKKIFEFIENYISKEEPKMNDETTFSLNLNTKELKMDNLFVSDFLDCEIYKRIKEID